MSTRQADEKPLSESSVCLARGVFMTPWGEGLATVGRGRLVEVELPPTARDESVVSSGAATENDLECLSRWTSQLEAYFRGERLSWSSAGVALETEGLTPFGKRTIECLMSVPAGCTVSYGSLAAMAGFPRAARAVGSLMASNPIPIVIPCHRVVRSDGTLGRYGNDPRWKERLLTHEQRYRGDGPR